MPEYLKKISVLLAAVMYACIMNVAGRTLTGRFTINDDGKQVVFSPGNLQYNAAEGTHRCADGTTAQGTWRFAEHQYDFVGNNVKGNVYHNGEKCSNKNISATYNGWIDLFGFGTSGWNSGAIAYQPYSSSSTPTDYYVGNDMANDLTGNYQYADWGAYNDINDGSATDPAGTWRTLTKEEWNYLLFKRKDFDKLFGFGHIEGDTGLILLPDDWQLPSGLAFNPSIEKGMTKRGTTSYSSTLYHYTDNAYTYAQWAEMEAAGAVFLPCAWYRYGLSISCTKAGQADGCYWTSSTRTADGYTWRISFTDKKLAISLLDRRDGGRSVRLVKDFAIPTTTLPDRHLCEGDAFLWLDGKSYTTSQTLTYTDKSKLFGCDSIITQSIIFHPTYDMSSTTEQVVVKESALPYMWLGTPRTETGIYSKTLPTADYGCDSIVYLDLSIVHNVSKTIDTTICHNSVFEYEGNQYDHTGTYTFLKVAPTNDPDTLITLHLTVSDPIPTTTLPDRHLCEGDEFLWLDGKSYTTGQTLTYTDKSKLFDCDSIITQTIIFHPTYIMPAEQMTIYRGQTYSWQGEDYTTDGTYTKRLTTLYGCDSLLTLNLFVKEIEMTEIEITDVEIADVCADDGVIHIKWNSTGVIDEVSVQITRVQPDRQSYPAVIASVEASENNVNIAFAERAGLYEARVDFLYQGAVTQTRTASFTLLYPSAVLEQKWDDVITVLNQEWNGGYDFIAFEWLKDGMPIIGENKSYLYTPLESGVEYQALLTEKNGMQLLTCPFLAALKEDMSLYPTIVSPSQQVRVAVSKPMQAEIYDISGRLISTMSLTSETTYLDLPNTTGLYAVRVGSSIYKIIVR